MVGPDHTVRPHSQIPTLLKHSIFALRRVMNWWDIVCFTCALYTIAFICDKKFVNHDHEKLMCTRRPSGDESMIYEHSRQGRAISVSSSSVNRGMVSAMGPANGSQGARERQGVENFEWYELEDATSRWFVAWVRHVGHVGLFARRNSARSAWIWLGLFVLVPTIMLFLPQMLSFLTQTRDLLSLRPMPFSRSTWLTQI